MTDKSKSGESVVGEAAPEPQPGCHCSCNPYCGCACHKTASIVALAHSAFLAPAGGTPPELVERIARNLYCREVYLKEGRKDGDLLAECVGSTQQTYLRWARFLLGEEVAYAPRQAVTAQALPARESTGFQVKIMSHTEDFDAVLSGPERVREIIGDAFDKHGLNEEVDYTLEVGRFYE